MGEDFIRAKGGKSYEKRWATGLHRLRTPKLTDQSIAEEGRTVTATLSPGYTPQLGTSVLVQTTIKGDLAVYEGLKQIASVADPPAGVVATVAGLHGVANAVVQRIGGFGSTVEVKL